MTPVTEPEPIQEPIEGPVDEAAVEPEPAETPLQLPLAPVAVDRVRPLAMAAAAVTALLVLGAALAGYAVTLGLALVLAVVLAVCWPALGGSVTPRATSALLAVSGAVVVASAVGEDQRWIAAAVAFGIILSFLHQLMRAPGREGLVLSLLASFGGLLLIASGATMAALSHRSETKGFVVVAMVALVAALLGDLLAGTRGAGAFLGFVALGAAVAGALLASLPFDEIGALEAAGLGAAVGTVSWSFRRILSGQPAMLAKGAQVAAGVGSVLATGAVVHLFAVIA